MQKDFSWVMDVNSPKVDNNLQVPFGVISSPFLLASTVDHYLSTYKTKTSENIRSNNCVDNVIKGVDTNEEGETLNKEAKEGFRSMFMNLRDWASNVKEFYRIVPPEDQSTKEKMKILGLTWSLTEDVLTVPVGNYGSILVPVTKREVQYLTLLDFSLQLPYRQNYFFQCYRKKS